MPLLTLESQSSESSILALASHVLLGRSVYAFVVCRLKIVLYTCRFTHMAFCHPKEDVLAYGIGNEA